MPIRYIAVACVAGAEDEYHLTVRLFLVRRSEPSKPVGSLASLSDAPPLKSGLSSLAGAPSLKDSESECPKVPRFAD